MNLSYADRAVSNQKLIEWEIDHGIVDVATFPNIVQFSPEHRCNLRCVMCFATVVRNQGQVPLMDKHFPDNTLERFEKLTPILPFFQMLALSGAGEPLLSRALPSILKVLEKHRDLPTTFTTHLQLLDRPKAEALVRSGVHAITVSMDGACKETYERIRFPSKWEKLIRAIDLLNQVKKELGSDRPAVCFAANCMRQNIEELPDLIDFAHAHGGVKVLATNTIMFDSAMEDQALVHYPELTRKMVVEAIRRAKRRGLSFENGILEPAGGQAELEAEAAALEKLSRSREASQSSWSFPTRETLHVLRKLGSVGTWARAGRRLARRLLDLGGRRKKPLDRFPPLALPKAALAPATSAARSSILRACQMPWTGLMVENDGNVKVCCYTSPSIGNLNDETLDQIWNGDRIKALRKSFLEDEPPDSCRNCFIFTKTLRKEAFVQTDWSKRSEQALDAVAL